jgi:hypothetical protein
MCVQASKKLEASLEVLWVEGLLRGYEGVLGRFEALLAGVGEGMGIIRLSCPGVCRGPLPLISVSSTEPADRADHPLIRGGLPLT